MSLLNAESYVFTNVFYLVLLCIHVSVNDVIDKKKLHNFLFAIAFRKCVAIAISGGTDFYEVHVMKDEFSARIIKITTRINVS